MRVILIEFNELSPFLLDGFISAGVLPHFARFRSESHLFISDTVGEGLQPWIEWVTVHSGLSRDEHEIRHLGQGSECKAPRIWDVVSEGGGRVWVCGSMNACFQGPVNGYFLPDPWAFREIPFPESLESFLGFVRGVVQTHKGKPGAGQGKMAARFLKFLAGNGLSWRTIGAFFKQLSLGAMGRQRWRRALLLDRFQFDIFRHVFERDQPEFSTFFSNSTAHLQHHFWGDAEEETFNDPRSVQAQALRASPIFQGYRNMDQLLGQFLELADENTALILCSSLGQQRNGARGENDLQFRAFDPSGFLRFAGVRGSFEEHTAMGAELDISFPSEKEAEAAHSVLENLRISGRKALILALEGKNLVVNFISSSPIPEDAVLEADGNARARFGDHFYMSGKANAVHHPEGICWIRLPNRVSAESAEKISLTSLAPTILQLLGRKIPSHMKGPQLELGT